MEEKRESHFIRKLIFIIILIIVLIIIYGYYIGTSIIYTNDYTINNAPSSFNDFKIGHFSDVLYSSSNDKELLETTVTKLNDKKLDVVIFSGDLIKKDYSPSQKEIDYITKTLNKINTKFGKYYVTGDNDLKNDLYDNIMQNSGFTSLNNSFDKIYSKQKESINIIGLTTDIDTSLLNDILNDNKANYNIIVFHESDSIEEIKNYNIDLALSSNSLNGQINIPGIKNLFLNKNSTKYYDKYYKVNKTKLYISNGIGNEKIHFRLFNNPSINIYTLKK